MLFSPFKSTVLRWLGMLMVGALLAACGGTDGARPRFSANFESGSIGEVKALDAHGRAWELALRNDNNNASLPNSFRTWWFVRADDVPVDQPLQLVFTRLGFPHHFVPVFSYDGKRWQHFDESEVTLAPGCVVAVPDSCRLSVSKRFDASTVWIARTFPYTTQDLAAFLESVASSPFVKLRSLGESPAFGLPLTLLTLSDDRVATPQQTVWIHARSHPAETGPSYLLEGLVRSVLADDDWGRALRERYVFQIVPMHNPDGVVLGNYRTNATSVNLENQWRNTQRGLWLDADAPLENRVLNQHAMVPALLDTQAPVTLALNLHSSNSAPDTAAFFFPHFGSDPALYSPAQRALWSTQLAFIREVAFHYDGRIEQPPEDGGAGFLNSWFPETWWWTHRQEAVNAITLETTYGRAGFDHWVTQDDLRALGVAVARAILGGGATGMPHAKEAASPAKSVFRLPYKPEIYQNRE